MTGYGSGRATADSGAQCIVEVQSVNRKQTELMINLPRDLSSLEPSVREIVNARVARGRFVINVNLQARPAVVADGAATAPSLDVATARAYYEAMRALQSELGAGGEISIETILRAPGVLRLQEQEAVVPEQLWPQIKTALEASLEALVEMRGREGQRLADDLHARLKLLSELLADIRAREPLVVQYHRQAMRERLARAGLESPIDEDRLAKEIALFADRSDISEEVTRLESHFEQFAALLDEKVKPVGRTLDFLTQEIARELNTLGAKANDLAIGQNVLAAKTELDKIREQVQNIE